ncbi:DUF4041 domain-containing protein [Brevibacterium antiquum]|uniref:DUF4041 domain-containing protein n=1 Tax=Brevibacterium antiquum TaxID=234835 RepID=UPI0038CC11BD
MSSAPPPGWYVDPGNNTLVRWFDGVRWTPHAQPRQPQQPPRLQQPLQPTSTQPPPDVGQSGPTEDTPRQEQAQSQPVRSNAAEVTSEKIGLFNGKRRARELQEELDELNHWIRQNNIDGAVSAQQVEKETIERTEEIEQSHQRELTAIRSELEVAQRSLETTRGLISDEQKQLVDIRAEAEVQDFGLFDFEHPAESSVQISADLDQVRTRYKSMVRSNSATTVTSGFTFNNSKSQGSRFLKNMSKLLLRAYNAEAENAVKSAKAGNLESCTKRLSKAREQVERNGQMIDLHIVEEYHRLRLSEIELANRHLQVKAREKELERERRTQLREEKKAEAEFKAKRADLLKEQMHYQNLADAMRDRGDSEGLERALSQLQDVEHSIADVDYRAANTRAGYVYVISNVGSFGKNVVKIGMTRRLDPMDRVRELGDASVPFTFDVHALFFSSDAVGIETMLHQTFSSERINRINLRREYFAVTPEQVLSALQNQKVEVVEYTLDAPAEQYRQSIVIRDKQTEPSEDASDSSGL